MCNKSYVGFTTLTNAVEQELTQDSVVNLGQINTQSKAENIEVLMGGQALQVNNCGIYSVDVEIIATPSASSDTTLAIFINGVQRATINMLSDATVSETIYSIRGIFQLNVADIITVQNVGTTLNLEAKTQPGAYNVNTLIQRYI